MSKAKKLVIIISSLQFTSFLKLFLGVSEQDLCMHGGLCKDISNSHRCVCATGYDGSYCETEINECASAPCKNGATCHDHIGRYNCDCPMGFQVRSSFPVDLFLWHNLVP